MNNIDRKLSFARVHLIYQSHIVGNLPFGVVDLQFVKPYLYSIKHLKPAMRKYILLLILPLLLSACEDSGSGDESFEYEDFITKTMEPGAVRLLDLRSTNGTINISGSDTAHYVLIEVTRRVKSYRSTLRAKDHIHDIQVSFDSQADGLSVVADHPNMEDLDYEIDFNVVAPIIFDYSILLGNGNISINSVSRNLDIDLGNGNMLADVILMNNCNVGLEAGNGSIHLIIPDITDALVNATVGNGSITDTGLEMTDRTSTGNSLSGKMGEGNGSIQVMLGNGDITLEGY